MGDQQKIIENEVLELHSFPSTNNGQWSGTNRVHSVIPTIIDGVHGNYDQEEPLNFVIGENENEDLELVIDEDFSSDVQNDINDERNICLHIPLKKRGKFSCNNCSLRKELKKCLFRKKYLISQPYFLFIYYLYFPTISCDI